MKVCGILAEYNPFHDGHAHQLEAARRDSGADYCVVLMSGSYTQRGIPAIYPKRSRAEDALYAGADLVLEFPVRFSTMSAEPYASAAVNIFKSLGIQSMSFGMESPKKMDSIREFARILIDEPEEYSIALRKALSEGMSFPLARIQALKEYGDTSVLDSPNNLLACEYCKAAANVLPGIPLELYPIGRISAPSASELRAGITDGLKADDFSLLLHEKLLRYESDGTDLGERIMNHRDSFETFTQFADLIKTRNYTYTRISRTLLRIMLGINEKDSSEIGYLNVLGFRREAQPLLSHLRTGSGLPLLINLPKDLSLLSGQAPELYAKDLYAEQLYRSAWTHKYGSAYPHVYTEPLLVV